MNYYELLEISPSASVDVIKNAYKTLAKKYHPDTYKGDRTFAEEKMKLLNEAVSVLENDDQRKEYDMINGIYHGSYLSDMSDDYYKDIESKLNINVDENGEPIFFSSDSYMDTIDDFINNKKSGRKTKKKAKNSKPFRDFNVNTNAGENDFDDISDMSDIDLEDISDIDGMESANYINDINDIDDVSDVYGGEFDDVTPNDDNADAGDLKTFNLLRGRNRQKNLKIESPHWVNITLIGLIAANIVIVFLLLRTVPWANLKSLLSVFSGNTTETDRENTHYSTDDLSDITSEDSANTEDISSEQFEPDPEETTDNPTGENEIIAGTTPDVTTAATTAPTEVIPVITPAPTPAPTVTTAAPTTLPPVVTEPITTEAPTEAPTVYTTEPDTTTEVITTAETTSEEPETTASGEEPAETSETVEITDATDTPMTNTPSPSDNFNPDDFPVNEES